MEVEFNSVILTLARGVLYGLPGVVLGLLMVPWVLNARKPAVNTIAWILAIVALPYLGILLYTVFGHRRIRRRVRLKREAHYAVASGLVDVKAAIQAERITAVRTLSALGPASRALIRMADAMGGYPATIGNAVELLVDGEGKFPALFDAVRNAQDHIHLEYYIFESDVTGTQLRDLLIERARAGVEVRVLVDAIGVYDQARGFFDPLEEVGGVVAFFMPVRLSTRRLDINFRNHRKIVVVDGRTGFLGGQNIGDEYSGMGDVKPAWHDIHLKVEGPAVHFLQETFMEDWFFTTGRDIVQTRYFPEHGERGDTLMQIIPSGPDLEWPTLHQLYFTAINSARERIVILNPYFVPTESLLSALIAAAHRGVDVQVILPHEGDQLLVFYASRSYYEELLKAGVRIYENDTRMVHAKVMAVDGRFCTVGSCNLDMRSFYLNFEVNALIYSKPVAERVEEVFEQILREVRPIVLDEFVRRPFHRRLAENTCRLLSPML